MTDSPTPQSQARALATEAYRLSGASDLEPWRQCLLDLAAALRAALEREGIETMEADAWHDRANVAEAREQHGRELLREAWRALQSDSQKAVTASAWAHGVQWDPKDSCDGDAIAAYLAEPAP